MHNEAVARRRRRRGRKERDTLAGGGSIVLECAEPVLKPLHQRPQSTLRIFRRFQQPVDVGVNRVPGRLRWGGSNADLNKAEVGDRE